MSSALHRVFQTCNETLKQDNSRNSNIRLRKKKLTEIEFSQKKFRTLMCSVVHSDQNSFNGDVVLALRNEENILDENIYGFVLSTTLNS